MALRDNSVECTIRKYKTKINNQTSANLYLVWKPKYERVLDRHPRTVRREQLKTCVVCFESEQNGIQLPFLFLRKYVRNCVCPFSTSFQYTPGGIRFSAHKTRRATRSCCRANHVYYYNNNSGTMPKKRQRRR